MQRCGLSVRFSIVNVSTFINACLNFIKIVRSSREQEIVREVVCCGHFLGFLGKASVKKNVKGENFCADVFCV